MKPITKTQFGDIYQNWGFCPLSDFAFFQEGPGLRKWQFTDCGMKVINVANILLDGTVDTSNSHRHISQEEFEQKYQHFAIEAGDTVVSSSGWSYGKVGRITAKHLPLMMNTSVIRFHPLSNESLDSTFLHYYLCSHFFQRQIEAYIIGSHQPNFGSSHIKRMKIVVPPVSTQRKIAGVLSAYDVLIENNTRRIAVLEEMAQAIYRAWFVNFRFPGHDKVKLINSPLGKIPEGWNIVPLKQITSKIGSGATPRGGKEAYKTSGISLIRSLNIYDNQFEHKDLAFIDDEQAAALDNVTIAKRDILLNITGASVARCCMVPSYLLPARVNQHVAIIRVDTAHADPFFVVNTINSERHKRQILALAQGGATREALTKDTISNYEIVLPTRDVYTRYGAIVADLFDQREVLQKKNNCLRTTRDLLLPKLISGQLDVEELDIETGEPLVEALM